MPMRVDPLKRSQNPRHRGSAMAETAGIAVSAIPRIISMIPEAMSQPLPRTSLEVAIPMYIIPDRIITMPNIRAIVR